MNEDDIDEVINQHLFSVRGRCECGEYVGENPRVLARHLARKIHEVLRERKHDQ
jgi:hypothetical protein